jgi:hypothetical protein
MNCIFLNLFGYKHLFDEKTQVLLKNIVFLCVLY